MVIKKIKEFNRTTLKSLRTDLNKEFEKLNKKFGINFSIGNISFDSCKFTTRLTVTTPVASKVKTETMNSALANALKREGIDKKWLNKSFSVPGRRGLWKLTEYKSSRPKYPWGLSEVNGTRKLKSRDIKRYLK